MIMSSWAVSLSFVFVFQKSIKSNKSNSPHSPRHLPALVRPSIRRRCRHHRRTGRLRCRAQWGTAPITATSCFHNETIGQNTHNIIYRVVWQIFDLSLRWTFDLEIVAQEKLVSLWNEQSSRSRAADWGFFHRLLYVVLQATDALLNLTASLTLSKSTAQLAFLPYSDRLHLDQSFTLTSDAEKVR